MIDLVYLFNSIFTGSLVLWCFVYRYLSFCTFSFGYCGICSSSIHGFWLPLLYLQTILNLSCTGSIWAVKLHWYFSFYYTITD